MEAVKRREGIAIAVSGGRRNEFLTRKPRMVQLKKGGDYVSE
jgi:hypothetical protein